MWSIDTVFDYKPKRGQSQVPESAYGGTGVRV